MAVLAVAGLLTLLPCSLVCSVARAQNVAGSTLIEALQSSRSADLNAETTRDLNQALLEHADLTVLFMSGRLALMEPLIIDTVSYYCAAYFEGEARMQFAPGPRVEQRQLRRFMDSDTLIRPVRQMLILGSPDLIAALHEQGTPAARNLDRKARRTARDRLSRLGRDKDRHFLFALLRNLLEPRDQPFLLLQVDPDKRGRLYYQFDPHEREEVTLWRHHSRPGESWMEPICAYPQRATYDHQAINGQSRGILEAHAYEIDGRLSTLGMLEASARVDFEVVADSSRFAVLQLHPDLRVTTITDSAGHEVAFMGHTDKRANRLPLYLFFDRSLLAGERVSLQLDYEGEIAHEQVGFFYITAGALWYPSTPERARAIYDIRFSTPRDYEFVATGRLVSRDTVGDILRTRWLVDPGTRNVSFSIGPMQRYEFTAPGSAPVDIYYSEDLHHELAYYLIRKGGSSGRDMEREVAADVLAALQLFSDWFGAFPYDRLIVSEILGRHGEAFPGFLHMGLPTWIQTDTRGSQRVFRSHEVAHQWWGVDLGYETYRDQWLSEAFAEYSALRYLQATAGDKRFYDMLEDYRKRIFSVRKYMLGDGAPPGAIALGYRNSTAETRGDYDLVVYKKGAWVLHMLRSLLVPPGTTDDTLFDPMIREFYQTFRGRDASTSDFIELAERYAGTDLSWFFDQWVYGVDLPEMHFTYRVLHNTAGGTALHCRVEVRNVDGLFRMPVPVELEWADGSRTYHRIEVQAPHCEVFIDSLPGRPAVVRLNPCEAVLAEIRE